MTCVSPRAGASNLPREAVDLRLVFRSRVSSACRSAFEVLAFGIDLAAVFSAFRILCDSFLSERALRSALAAARGSNDGSEGQHGRRLSAPELFGISTSHWSS